MQRVELAGGGIGPINSHPISLLENVEQEKIVAKSKGMGDQNYMNLDSFIVEPKISKNTMGNAQTHKVIFNLQQ